MFLKKMVVFSVKFTILVCIPLILLLASITHQSQIVERVCTIKFILFLIASDRCSNSIAIKDVDINNILVCGKISSGEKKL